MRLKLWLPPKTWLHGSQSRIFGGRAATTGIAAATCVWLTHSIPCVVSTPFGFAVDPEVKMIFAKVSGPTFAWAASTSALASPCSRRAKARALARGVRGAAFLLVLKNRSGAGD